MFYYCDYSNAKSLPGFDQDLVITKWDCLNIGGDYLRKDSTFDDLG